MNSSNKLRKNELQEKEKKIRSILDRDYFHICTEVKLNKELKWAIYYKNLPSKAYYSEKNKPLLTSEKNTISDIYKLKNKFESEKRIEQMKSLYEEISLLSCLNKTITEIHRIFSKFSMIVLLTILILNLENMFFLHNVNLSLVLLFITSIEGLRSIYYAKILEKQRKLSTKKMEEIYLKEKIKRQGFYFLEKIKIQEEIKNEKI